MKNEWIFAINDFDDPEADFSGFVVTINSKEFWKREECLSDETPDEIRDQMEVAGFGELMENTWEPSRSMTKEEAVELMEMNGFIHDAEMEEWLDRFKE